MFITPIILSLQTAIGLAAAPAVPVAAVLRTYQDTHASQGVAVDTRSIYAVSNSKIVKFDKRTGIQTGQWSGDPARHPHINSCAVIAADLVCASSNYPAVPMRSTVEVFNPKTMTLIRSIPLEGAPGSVTWIDRRAGSWWVGFANYDAKGGEPGRDHTFTAMVQYDNAWRPKASWGFPASVLERFKPYSTSGGGFGGDGLLYVSGHDRPELYALRVPAAGGELTHLATIPIAVDGQAIAWDRGKKRVLYGISRASGAVVAMRVPAVGRRPQEK